MDSGLARGRRRGGDSLQNCSESVRHAQRRQTEKDLRFGSRASRRRKLLSARRRFASRSPSRARGPSRATIGSVDVAVARARPAPVDRARRSRVARASASSGDEGVRPAKRARRVRRLTDTATGAPRSERVVLSTEERARRAEALRLRDVRARAADALAALARACADDDVRRAQVIKSSIIDDFGIDALDVNAHQALIELYCRHRLCALAERAFADALRAGAAVSDDCVWSMIDAFERSGDVYAPCAEDALEYLQRRRDG